VQIGTLLVVMLIDGFHPAVGMHSEGEEVKIDLDAKWEHSDVILMSIDSCEEDWSRLHGIRINGQVHYFKLLYKIATNKIGEWKFKSCYIE